MSQGQKVNLYSRVPSIENDGNVLQTRLSKLTSKDSAVDFSTVRLLELPPLILEVIESSNPPEYIPAH
jgi:hypothetical protein